ncbi:MAG TPA: protein kinase, partial [Planctomycetota bacterium]|nr:protein kinase [Planctomycetota bacterium]
GGPRRVGDYEIVSELGRGSMGVVFLVRKKGVERDLALKVISDSKLANPTSRERFRREARMLAKVNHPGVLRVHDAGEEQGLLYYVMDVVKGESLEDRVGRTGPLPVPLACSVLRDVALALDEIHRQGIVHRDMKPANVLLDERTGKPLIADFGLARDVMSEDERLTKTGHSVGTPAFMSPEQVRARRDVDARADVYALGAILYFTLTGTDPFPAESIEELVRQILQDKPEPPSKHVASIPPAVDEVCLRALAKKREDRMLAASDFAAELARAAAAPRPKPPRRWPRLALYGGGGALAASLLASMPLYASLQELERSREALARREATLVLAKVTAEETARQDALVGEAQEKYVEQDREAAIAKARAALRRHPDDPRALALVGRALIASSFDGGADSGARLQEGRTYVGRAQEKAPSSPGVLLARVELAIADDKRSEATPLLREVLSRGTVLERLEAVSSWLNVVGPQELERLLSVVDACLAERQTQPEGHFLRGLVLDCLNKKAEAKQELDRCLQLGPSRNDARRYRATIEDDLGLLDAAKDDLARLHELYPASGTYTFLLGVNAEKRNDAKEALRLYAEALEKWPKDSLEPVHTRRGLFYFAQNDWEHAASDLEIATTALPIASHLKKLAVSYEKLGWIGKARDAWEAALKQNPYDADLVLDYGALREVEDAPAPCIAYYKEAEKEVTREAGRARIEERIRVQEKRQAAEKELTEEERVAVLKARNARTQHRIDTIQKEQDAAKSLPAAEQLRKLDILKRELQELHRYLEETRRFEKP